MTEKENISLDERLIGQVKWYGGYNRKKDRENNFGFLDDAEGNSIFVHASGLICAPSDMEEGRWVTFRSVEGEKKGKSAVDVELVENEANHSAISRLLKDNRIPIETRFKVCFNIPLEENQPLIPVMEKIMAEFDRSNFMGDIVFPNSWKELNRDSALYKILPERFRQDWFNQVHPGIKRSIYSLSSSVSRTKRNAEIYISMSPQDRQLALSWAHSEEDYEKAKMLSARGAELIAAEFFAETVWSVQDIAIHQVTGESDEWKYNDLLIDSIYPVDVKNARTTINSNIFVEYTIKRFKKNSLGMDVIIVGILSPYLTLEKLKKWEIGYRDSIRMLGMTTQNQVKNLEREFSKRELTVDFGDSNRWPIWIFHNDFKWFPDQSKAVAEFSKFASEVKFEDWGDCKEMAIPAFVIAGMDLPGRYREELMAWQKWYLDKIVKKAASGELTLPWLYLFTFHHFLEAITKVGAAESMQYSPEGYGKLLFYSDANYERPASLIDPIKIIGKLIGALNTLWDHRHSANLVSLRNFVFRGEGLLRGTDPRGTKVTVLAYCGGFIKKQGKCGNSPLVIGQHETCSSCQMLKCDKCGYCSERCNKMVDE